MLWNATVTKQISQIANNRTAEQQNELKRRDPTVDYAGNNNNRVVGPSLGINYRVF